MNQSVLESIGLTGNEARVYLTLLKMGSTPAGPLIKKVGMHRAAVYDTIDLLMEKGIVSYVIMANRKYFEAQDPDRLLEYLDTKKQEIEQKQLDLRSALPELQMMKAISSEVQAGNIYKGLRGLKSIFEDILKQRKDMLAFGASGKFKELFGPYFTNFSARRAKLRIRLKIIFSSRAIKEDRMKELRLVDARYLPEADPTPATTYVYADRVAIVIWLDEPMAFLIKSKKVADSYRTHFDFQWKHSLR